MKNDKLLSPDDVLADRYRVLSYISEGGMQQVYEALDTSFDRLVAVKAPKNASAIKRFDRSARVSARITHRHVAKTLDFFDDKGGFFLVEELIRGRDLRAAMAQDYTLLDPHLVASLIHRISRAVAAAHHAGVVHRDLKPGNIMVSPDAGFAEVKITDFGIAKMTAAEMADAIDREDPTSITGSQTAMGALPYMAPEMIETPKDADKPADVWAVGALAYDLLTGTVPFGSGLKAVPKILDAKLPDRPRLLGKRQFAPLGDDLWKILEACMQKEPTARPTADQLVGMCDLLCYSKAQRRIGLVAEYGTGTGSWGRILSSPTSTAVFFCIGTDPFHTPSDLVALLVDCLRTQSYSVGVAADRLTEG